MKNWPNEPPAAQMPTASAALAGGATRRITPSTGPKVAGALQGSRGALGIELLHAATSCYVAQRTHDRILPPHRVGEPVADAHHGQRVRGTTTRTRALRLQGAAGRQGRVLRARRAGE